MRTLQIHTRQIRHIELQNAPRRFPNRSTLGHPSFLRSQGAPAPPIARPLVLSVRRPLQRLLYMDGVFTLVLFPPSGQPTRVRVAPLHVFAARRRPNGVLLFAPRAPFFFSAEYPPFLDTSGKHPLLLYLVCGFLIHRRYERRELGNLENPKLQVHNWSVYLENTSEP